MKSKYHFKFEELSIYKKAMIITSNRDLSEWPSVFTNGLIASAAMDRLLHKGIECVIDGGSYRLDQFKKENTSVKKEVKNK